VASKIHSPFGGPWGLGQEVGLPVWHPRDTVDRHADPLRRRRPGQQDERERNEHRAKRLTFHTHHLVFGSVATLTMQDYSALIHESLGDQKRALEDLRRAVRGGYSKSLIKRDPALKALRNDADFRRVFDVAGR
jgi:hypothetical protein